MNIQNANWLSAVGLILDIIGVLLLFAFGLPSKIELSGGGIAKEETREEEKKREKANGRIVLGAKIGLWMIIIGFAFQVAGCFKQSF